MVFVDFEKIIRDNYPIMIESYVKQYGEEYREHITSVLERVKFCIFETPLTISQYVKRKKNEDFMKAILDSYVELDIDISGILIDEEGFVFNDEKVGRLTKVFFPVIDTYENIRNRGIFAFNDCFDSLDLDDPIFKERIRVLEELNLKNPKMPVDEYIKTKEYKRYCTIFRGALGIVLERMFYRCNDDYLDYIKYADELEDKINDVAKKYEREYLLKIREYLSDSDKELLDKGCIKELEDYYLYFDDSLEKDCYAFAEGCLEYFCDSYTELLMDKHVCKESIDEILEMRFKYLSKKGFDTSILKREDLLCDWYELDYLKDYLPDLGIVSECLLRRDLVNDEYEYEIAKLCIINDYELHPLDSEIATIIESDGHSCGVDTKDLDVENPVAVVCISPLNDTYNLFDIALDHELRHAIEMYVKEMKSGYLVKMGTDVSLLDKDFMCVRAGFTDYNERVTQKLSVEACQERWKKGKFIFSDPYALITSYCISCYDYDIDNLDIIFEPFRDELIDAQISDDFDKIYGVIPKNLLRSINNNITNHSKRAIKRLHVISNELENRRIESAKVKKIGSINE